MTINGARETLDVSANLTLLQLLREKLALTGAKNGCAAGECGACTVMMDGEPVNSCMVLAVEADGASRALLDRNPDPSEEDIREALVGNLCRCTGYTRIVRAVLRAVQHAARAEV